MAEKLDRRALKDAVCQLLAQAQVSPKGMTALYLGIVAALSLVVDLSGSFLAGGVAGGIATFLNILSMLVRITLGAGFTLYCMAIRRGERTEYLTLFDAFSFVGKLIGLTLVTSLFIWLWSMLFVIPGIIAAYRYRFATLNLLENPDIGVMEALEMSKRQTYGYKAQLFALDLSYFGWGFLASIPAVVYNAAVQMEIQTAVLNGGGLAAIQAAAARPVMGLPDAVWGLIVSLWGLAVSLFYLPNYQCVELDYFDAAKRTSGVSAPAARLDSPDGL